MVEHKTEEKFVNFKRFGALAGIATVAVMGVAACSSDDEGTTDSNGGGDSTAAANDAAAGDDCTVDTPLSASGSSAQRNAMTVFQNDFSEKCGGQLDYNANGSGSGIKEFTGGQTAFGGSDSPLKEEEYTTAEGRCGAPAWNLPMVFGPIAVAYKIEGVDNLNLSPEVIAQIFKGEITKWNDPAIAELNDGTNLPDTDITVVFRADESGTTDNFQQYLDAAAGPAWGLGAGKTFNGGTGQGANGNDGVSSTIAGIDGAITYAEWSFATGQNLGVANVTTSASEEPVELNAETVGKTIETAALKNGEDSHDMVLDTSSFYKPTEAGAYPIVLATYEVVCSKYDDAEMGNAVKSFLNVAASDDTQAKLEAEGYSPIPDSFREKLNSAIDAIEA